MKMNIILDKIINNIGLELKNEKTLNNLKKKVIQPIILNTIIQLYPYLILSIVIIVTLFVLIFTILFLNIKIYNYNK